MNYLSPICKKVIESPLFFNLTISALSFFAARKLREIESNNAWVSNVILPIGQIGCYISSYRYFSLLQITYNNSNLLYVLSKILNVYTYVSTECLALSSFTFIIGYPSISVLFKYCKDYLRNATDSIFSEIKSEINKVESVYNNFSKALKENKNCDIVIGSSSFPMSIRTWSTPKPIVNQEQLDKTAPLRCAGMKNKSTSEFISSSCSICCEEFETKELHRELPCKHTFHPHCIDEWLLNKDSTCPICRKKVL